MTDEELTAHPLAQLIPPMAADELDKLVSDIRTNGLIEPIIIYQGQILDGRHRHLACQLADVAPKFTEYSGSDPLAFVLSKNLHRRHLSSAQRAAIAMETLPLLEEQAKARQGTRTELVDSEEDANFQEKIPGSSQARDQAAELQSVKGARGSRGIRLMTDATAPLSLMARSNIRCIARYLVC